MPQMCLKPNLRDAMQQCTVVGSTYKYFKVPQSTCKYLKGLNRCASNLSAVMQCIVVKSSRKYLKVPASTSKYLKYKYLKGLNRSASNLSRAMQCTVVGSTKKYLQVPTSTSKARTGVPQTSESCIALN